MDRLVNVALVGISGYGRSYLNMFLGDDAVPGVKLVACMDTSLERCEDLDTLKDMGVALYDTYEAFLAHEPADLVVISSPIHFHAQQTVAALANGSNVLVEKPVASTIQEAQQMMAAEKTSGKFAAVGYQWSFANAIHDLKEDILGGMYGAPLRLKTGVCWPRALGYYARNAWAGMLKTPRGEWVLDSPINNATAHYLHNMLFVLGDAMETAAIPVEVTGELYRANAITNFDFGALRAKTARGVELMYWSAHCIEELRGPVAVYEFEKGRVVSHSQEDGGEFVATMTDGTTKHYGSPNADQANKFLHCVEAVLGKRKVACTIATASSQTVLMNGLQDSSAIHEFPANLVRSVDYGDAGDKLVAVDGLSETIWECFESNQLPSELGAAWAQPGKTVNLEGYTIFPSKA